MTTMDELVGLVPETPNEFGDSVYIARRDPELVDGMPRWQVFVNDKLTPIGFLQGHRCPPNNGAPGLLAFAPNNRPMWAVKPGKGDGCPSSYRNCLLAFHTPMDPDGHPSYRRSPDGSHELRRPGTR